MEVILQVDKNTQKPKIIICTPKKSSYFDDLVNKIRRMLGEEKINVKQGSDYLSVKISDIERIYTENHNVFCEINSCKYKLKERIYEMVDLLPHDTFFQISQSEIVNRKFIDKFRLTSTGLYQVILKNDVVTYASRRCMYKIKKEYLKWKNLLED